VTLLLLLVFDVPYMSTDVGFPSVSDTPAAVASL
jgi:hypothetical protein